MRPDQRFATEPTRERVESILRVSGAGCVLLASERRFPVACTTLPIVEVPINAPLGDSAAALCPLPQGEMRDGDTAYVLFSSGTTGAPKGVAVSYSNLADFVGWLETDTYLFGRSADERGGTISGNVRYCFDVSLFELWLGLLHRRTIVASDHSDLVNLSYSIERFAAAKLSTFVSTPSLAVQFIRSKQFCAEALPSLKRFVFCGEILSQTLAASLYARFPKAAIVNTYGPTECTVAVTGCRLTEEQILSGLPLPIGRARPGTQITIEAGPDGSGEMVVSGDAVGPGYLGDPDQQAKQFPKPGVYRTGDNARLEVDGLFYFLGRRDREVKLNGYRIDLNTVESAVRDAGGIDAVARVEGSEAKPHLAVYVAGPADTRALAKVAEATAALLPHHMMPRRWRGHDRFMLNMNGKLDRAGFVAALQADSGAPALVHAGVWVQPALSVELA